MRELANAKGKAGSEEATAQRKKAIVDLVASSVQLRSKRELIEIFIEENLPKLKSANEVEAAFEAYWDQHKQQAFQDLCAEESIAPDALQQILKTYVFANRLPREQEIVEALAFKPKILERKRVITRIADKIKAFIDTFVEGMGGSV